MCTEMAAVSRGITHVTIKQHSMYTTFMDINIYISKMCCVPLQSLIQSGMQLKGREFAQKQTNGDIIISQ